MRYLRLTRPTDDETAVLAGLDAAIGDYVVTLNPDFDPPAEIPAMVDSCRAGNDLVLGVDRHPTRPGFAVPRTRSLFRAVAGRLVRSRPRDRHERVPRAQPAGGERAREGPAPQAALRHRRRRRGPDHRAAPVRPHLAPRAAADAQPVPVAAAGSVSARSQLARAARIASALGLLGSALSLTYSLYVVAVYVLKEDVMPGWTTLSLAISGLFGLAFLMLALMGEYLGRLLEESSARPLYHLRDEVSSAVMLAETRRNVLDRSDAACTRQIPTFESHEFRPRCGGLLRLRLRHQRGRQVAQAARSAMTATSRIGSTSSSPTAAAPTARPPAPCWTPRGVNTLLVKTGPGKLSAQMRMALRLRARPRLRGRRLHRRQQQGRPRRDPAVPRKRSTRGSTTSRGRGSSPAAARKTAGSCAASASSCCTRRSSASPAGSATRTRPTASAPTAGGSARTRAWRLPRRLRAYELHYYLAIRAERLGFRSREFPVAPALPRKGPTPTKICPVRGNLRVLEMLCSRPARKVQPEHETPVRP